MVQQDCEFVHLNNFKDMATNWTDFKMDFDMMEIKLPTSKYLLQK